MPKISRCINRLVLVLIEDYLSTCKVWIVVKFLSILFPKTTICISQQTLQYNNHFCKYNIVFWNLSWEVFWVFCLLLSIVIICHYYCKLQLHTKTWLCTRKFCHTTLSWDCSYFSLAFVSLEKHCIHKNHIKYCYQIETYFSAAIQRDLDKPEN